MEGRGHEGQVWLVQVWLGQARLGQARLGQVSLVKPQNTYCILVFIILDCLVEVICIDIGHLVEEFHVFFVVSPPYMDAYKCDIAKRLMLKDIVHMLSNLHLSASPVICLFFCLSICLYFSNFLSLCLSTCMSINLFSIWTPCFNTKCLGKLKVEKNYKMWVKITVEIYLGITDI